MIFQPLEDSLRVSTIIRVAREVSITDLGGDETYSINLNLDMR